MGHTTPRALIPALLPEWEARLQGWARDGSLAAAAQEALILDRTPEALQDLISQWSAGAFSSLPPVVLLSSEAMNGAMGAYAISNGTIYLNADWLKRASKEQVLAVLTEELGHHLDGLLNAADTPGDEGEYFARLLAGERMSSSSISLMRSQTDRGGINIGNQSTQVEMATAPLLRGNSVYIEVSGSTWNDANQSAIAAGGNLVSIGGTEENAFITQGFSYLDMGSAFIGYTVRGDGLATYPYKWTWTSGEPNVYTNWAAGEPNGPAGQIATTIYLYKVSLLTGGIRPEGYWNDVEADKAINQGLVVNRGIAEVPLSLSITRSGTPKEAAGLFSTSINLSAGSQASGNLAEGATVYWKVTGITADDLASGSLTGTGVITNGKLQIRHSFKQDADTGEQFSISVFSDLGLTQQIGTTSSAAVLEAPTPVIRGNSLYTIVDGPSWTQAEENSVLLGGHLISINNSNEQAFIQQSGVLSETTWTGYTDAENEGTWKWISGDTSTYTNWAYAEPNGGNSENYGVIYSTGYWNDGTLS